MKIGLALQNFGNLASPENLKASVLLAEKLGFESAWTTDHLLIPFEQPGEYGTIFETLSTLAFLSGLTSKIKLGTSILVMPLRNPIVVAKQIATIDVFSNGRLILEVGCGWLAKEFHYLNADFPRRFQILDEEIALIKSIWAQEILTYDSEFFHIDKALANPKPIQKPSVPIYLGGNSRLSAKRAALYGDGWQPVGLSPDKIADGAEYIEKLRGSRYVEISARNPVKVGGKKVEYGGASSKGMYVLQGDDDQVLEEIREFEKAGVEHLVLYPLASSGDELFSMIQEIGEKMLTAVR